MEKDILKEVFDSLEAGIEVALVTITNMIGSTPRKKGSIMAVWKDGKILGSIGGGSAEHKIIIKAIECINNREDREFEYKLNDQGDLDAQCGGEVKGFIKVFKPRPKLLIVGAGHIGLHLAKLGKMMDFHTVVFDDREEYANDNRFNGIDEILVGEVGESLSKYEIDNKTYVVIVSRGHRCDADALRAVISRGAAYIGMIGSVKKCLFIMNNMIDDGFSKEELKKVYAPIGLNISNETPEEIALGIISEILLVKNKGSLEHFRDIKKVNLDNHIVE